MCPRAVEESVLPGSPFERGFFIRTCGCDAMGEEGSGIAAEPEGALDGRAGPEGPGDDRELSWVKKASRRF